MNYGRLMKGPQFLRKQGFYLTVVFASRMFQDLSFPPLENVFGFNHKYEVKDYLNIKHLRCFQDRPLNFLSLACAFHCTISRQKEITISLELLHFLLVPMINGYNSKSTLDLISIGGHRMLLDSCSSGVELADWESSPTIKSSKYQSRQLFSPSHLLLNSQPLCFLRRLDRKWARWT